MVSTASGVQSGQGFTIAIQIWTERSSDGMRFVDLLLNTIRWMDRREDRMFGIKSWAEKTEGSESFKGKAVTISTDFGIDKFKVHEVNKMLGIYSQTNSSQTQNTIKNL